MLSLLLACHGCAGEPPDALSGRGKGTAGRAMGVGLLDAPEGAAAGGASAMATPAESPAAGRPGQLAAIDLRSTQPSPFAAEAGATGRALVTVLEDRSELCVEMAVAGLSQPTAVHLHESVTDGEDVVLALKAPPSGDGTVDACVSAPSRVLDRIVRSPSRFSINVKTSTVPQGALRGELR